MGEITLAINDIKVTVPEDTTILDAARSVDIYVPTLCSHPSLSTSRGLEHEVCIVTSLVRQSVR